MLDKPGESGGRESAASKIRSSRPRTVAINIYAQSMADDAEQAMGVAASGDVQFAQYSSNIICFDEDLDRLHENTRLVMKKIQNLGFACRLGNDQRRRGVARQSSRRRIPERSPGSSAHAESG